MCSGAHPLLPPASPTDALFPCRRTRQEANMLIPLLAHPLPMAADVSVNAALAAHRRSRAGTVPLDPDKLLRFNERIAHLLGNCDAIDCDGLACIARRLLQAGSNHMHPACIAERMRCAAAMDLMLRDLDWEPDAPAARVCTEVIAYLRSSVEQLIPNAEPIVGRLDDAILVDRAWPLAENEVLLYCDFRRLRLIEAELRGSPVRAMHFGRDDYLEARTAEARLLAVERRIGLESYTPRPTWSNGPMLYSRPH
jgi:hypothetical protein